MSLRREHKRSALYVSNREAISRIQMYLANFSERELQKLSRLAKIGVLRAAGPIVRRRVRESYGVKLSALTGRIRIDDRSRKATVAGGKREARELVVVSAWSRRINLMAFGGRWSRPKGGNLQRMRSKGATAQIEAGQRKAYAGSFIADIGWRGVSGGEAKADTVRRGIYVRRFVNGVSGKRYGRGPVALLKGPSPLEMIRGLDDRNTPRIVGDLLKVWRIELVRQAKRLESKRSG